MIEIKLNKKSLDFLKTGIIWKSDKNSVYMVNPTIFYMNKNKVFIVNGSDIPERVKIDLFSLINKYNDIVIDSYKSLESEENIQGRTRKKS